LTKKYQEPSGMAHNLLFITSIISDVSVHRNAFCNTSNLPHCVATCKTARSLLSVPINNFLFTSSAFSFSLDNSHTFCKISELHRAAV